MNRKLILPVLALGLALLACNLQPAASTPTATLPPAARPSDTPVQAVPTDTPLPPAAPSDTPLAPTATLTSAPVTPTGSSLTLDQLKNATYTTPGMNHTIKLVNGAYSEGSGANAYSVQMLEVYAFGDLNGDGKADAAVILAENGGGSGIFESVIAVTDQAGQPHQQSQLLLGDRIQIKSVDISFGVVHLDMMVQGPNDPLCCPSLAQKQNFWLIDNRLWLMRVTSTLAGTVHYINVDLPGIWSTVSNPFTVSGSLSVLPFENTLAYKIYKTDGTKVNESSLTVTPASGPAGTFTHSFNLSSAGITDWVILQFIDTSAADGSTISMGSVILKAH